MPRLPEFIRNLRERQIEYESYELAIMRALFALVAYDVIDWSPDHSGQPNPNGLGHIIDFTFLSDPAVMSVIRVVFIAALFAYVVGIAPLLSAGLVLAITIADGTLENSQGSIGHNRQIVSLILLAQWLVYAIRGKGALLRPSALTQNLAVHWGKVTVAAAYVVSALMKLINSDGLWIAKVPLLSLQVMKANLRDHYNDLQPTNDFFTTRVPELIIAHPNLARIAFGSALVLELLCFLALAGRRWAFLYGLALIAMHLSIHQVMSLTFVHHMAVLVIFYVNLPGIGKLFAPDRELSNSPH